MADLDGGAGTDDDTYAIPAVVKGPGKPAILQTPLVKWLMELRVAPVGPEAEEDHATPNAWWKVVCLTGVDYFSTLSYLPGIAALAAGALSPLATLLIVALTLFGMLPMYCRVAKESPHGQGSVAMLERLLPFWRGKFFVLGLLGFVATSWIITITLSAADASVHINENPAFPGFLHGHQILMTVVLLLVLGGVFLLGFSEAVGVAVPLVVLFLAVNAVVVVAGVQKILANPDLLSNWQHALTQGHTPGLMGLLIPAFIAFPLLVLGLSGFETGVSMMPLIAAKGSTPEEQLASRIRNARKLLVTAAAVMSVYLIATSFITTIVIPAQEFEEGGKANGRALAYLAHELLGNTFGTVYDISSVLILWFAGASAMAGLINIVPRYLPGYGMAPEWTRWVRPVVFVYTAISILITLIFQADVNAQAGAYATGVLAMMVSATFAVSASAYRMKQKSVVFYGFLTVIMAYALIENIREKPDGITISVAFIGGIIVISLVSRISRTTELRADAIEFDDQARQFITDTIKFDNRITIIANKQQSGDENEYLAKEMEQRLVNPVPGQADIMFLEIEVTDPSDFGGVLQVRGVEVGAFRILHAQSPAVPNAIAAILMALRNETGILPQCHLAWSEGSPLKHMLRVIVLGQGDTAPVVREIIRKAEADPGMRPGIHVG
ncbi:hypothetical protein [Smaragdicoccus niigatensis]|uniref:hypothetical protein n=1 Tax=Smaragdicoccus niigatensis TaxID=359359 RepID=UPI000363A14C|nr:hypothetical protein [Smaragdicoccus niigatensis]